MKLMEFTSQVDVVEVVAVMVMMQGGKDLVSLCM